MEQKGFWGGKIKQEDLASIGGTVEVIKGSGEEKAGDDHRSIRIEFDGNPEEGKVNTAIMYSGDVYDEEGGRLTLANDLYVAMLAVLDCPSPYMMADLQMEKVMKAVQLAKSVLYDEVIDIGESE